jgi:hypothetical protein
MARIRHHQPQPAVHIFIDESGNFTQGGNSPGVSLVGALIIPECTRANIERKYARLRPSLLKDRGEVKGRLLQESQVAAVIEILRRNQALLEVVCIDLDMHEDADLAAHREGQAAGIERGAMPQHPQEFHDYLNAVAARVRAMPFQLYAQMAIMFELVRHASEIGINYFAQRQPKELAEFHWMIDAKGKDGRTNWEKLWADIVMPVIQSKSITSPTLLYEDGDYTHYARFASKTPDWLPLPKSGSRDATNIRLLLMEHFSYSSDAVAGLELADIVVSATRRALVGTLQQSGWGGLPSLMVHRAQHYIHMAALHERELIRRPTYRRILLEQFARGGRDMLAPRFRD